MHSLKMLRRVIVTFFALVVSIGIATPLATADDQGRYLTISLVGDSYTSGNGAGGYYGPQKLYRSAHNWGHSYARWLNEQGVHSIVRNYSFSGATTDDVLKKQIPEVDPNSDVVMLTVGGNDVDFTSIVTNCYAIGIRSISTCQKSIESADKQIPHVIAQTEKILHALQERIKHGAEIVLVGYPLLSKESDYVIQPWLWGTPYPAAFHTRELGKKATIAQRDLVEKWNANSHNKLHASYVAVENHFDGHEPDPEVSAQNPYRWINEFFETEGKIGADGRTESVQSITEVANWYHPNIIGHTEIANLLGKTIGIPKSVRTARNEAQDIDLVFVVDNSLTQHAWLGDATKQIRRIFAEATTRAGQHGKTVRAALMTYLASAKNDVTDGSEILASSRTEKNGTTEPRVSGKSAPDNTEARKDAIEKTSEAPLGDTKVATGQLTFDTTVASLTAKLDAVTHGKTLTTASTLRSALKDALTQNWRKDARKIVVLLGTTDPAPSKDDPSWEDLEIAAFGADSAELLVIEPGEKTSKELTQLAMHTGGHVTQAKTLKPLIVAPPNAFISAPKQVSVGESIILDGSGSYAEEGAIVRYEWDLDGDGTYEHASSADGTIGANPLQGFKAQEVGKKTISLRVTDAYGKQAMSTVEIAISSAKAEDSWEAVPLTPLTPAQPGQPNGEASVAPQADDTTQRVHILLKDTKVRRGDVLAYGVKGVQPQEKVSLEIHSTPLELGSMTANARGLVAGLWTVPANFPIGRHTLAVKTHTGDFQVTFDVLPNRDGGKAAEQPMSPAPQRQTDRADKTSGNSTDAELSLTGSTAFAQAGYVMSFLTFGGLAVAFAFRMRKKS
ncbi:GDSL-type esterase/lipase family protein [Arcanobacterium canis]